MKKFNICQIAFISMLGLYSACSYAAVPIAMNINSMSNIKQELAEINQSVNQLKTNITHYTAYQLNNEYPTTPFPGWQNIISIDKDHVRNILGLLQNTPNPYSKKKMLKENIKDINRYIIQYQNIIFQNTGKMTAIEVQRVNMRINLLNTTINELRLLQSQKNAKQLNDNTRTLNTLIQLEKMQIEKKEANQ